MLKDDVETMNKVLELLDHYYDKGKVRILAMIAAGLGYRLVKYSEKDSSNEETKP